MIKIAQIDMFSASQNSPITTLSVGIDDSVTIISVTDASKLATAPNLATIGGGVNAETIKYTGISGNDLTGVTRGFQGIASAWDSGISIMRAFTAYDHDTFKNNIEDLNAEITLHQNNTDPHPLQTTVNMSNYKIIFDSTTNSLEILEV